MKNLQKEQCKSGSYNWDQFFLNFTAVKKEIEMRHPISLVALWRGTHERAVDCELSRAAKSQQEPYLFFRGQILWKRPWLFHEVAVKTWDRTFPASYLFGIDHRAVERIRFQVPHHFKCPRKPGAEILYFQVFRSWRSPTKQQGLRDGIRI